MMKLFSKKNGSAGFSLVELMVAMVIAAVSMAAIYGVFVSVQKANTSNEVAAQVLNTLRTSLEIIESDIRLAGLDRFGNADAGFEIATANSLRFTADRNMDGTINTDDQSDGLQESDFERITYSYDAANRRLRQCLSEGTTNAWDTVAENVDNFILSYFDENNQLIVFPIADLRAIRIVEVSLTITQPAGLAPEVTKTLSKKIQCRNYSR